MSELLSHSEKQNSVSKKGFDYLAFALGMLLGVCIVMFFTFSKVNTEVKPELYSDQNLTDTVLLIEQAMQQVSSDYIDEIPVQELAEAALQGMFTTLDNHSLYLDEDTYQKLITQTDGEYLGIGIEVEEKDGHVLIAGVLENSPAAETGLQIKDEIIAVNGHSVQEQSYKILLAQPSDKVDSKVTLSIRRSAKEFEVSLARGFIPIKSIYSALIEANTNSSKRSVATEKTSESLAYIRISHFNEQTPVDLGIAIENLENTPGDLYGLILDLRNNPGGLVNAAVEVADLFLQSGTIVSANGRAADADFKYKASTGELFSGLPVVVLINGATASAAEIVAAALKEQDRATLVGENSYGKGLVQTIIPLSSGALKLTTSRYYTPSGLSINERGIRPNVKIADSEMIMAMNELKDSKHTNFPQFLAIKDPALLRAWQHINRVSSRDQLAMDKVLLETGSEE